MAEFVDAGSKKCYHDLTCNLDFQTYFAYLAIYELRRIKEKTFHLMGCILNVEMKT